MGGAAALSSAGQNVSTQEHSRQVALFFLNSLVQTEEFPLVPG